jgi:hypothetical protein
MRAVWLFWAVLLSSVAWANAQIKVEVLLDQTQFLRDESVQVKIHITNLSGQPVQLADDLDWLNFQVEYDDNKTETRTAQIPAGDAFTLQSAKAVVRQFDLMPFFDFSRTGRYNIAATVRIKSWNQEFSSNPKTLEITAGLQIWEHDFGVPVTNRAPEMRKYSLVQASYQARQNLYVRLTDISNTKVFRVIPVAPLVSFSKPEAQIDQESNLHVLSQTGPSAFIYMIVSPRGEIRKRYRYDYSDTRPVLRPLNDKIIVSGGARHRTDEDIPPNPIAPLDVLTNAPSRGQTNSR